MAYSGRDDAVHNRPDGPAAVCHNNSRRKAEAVEYRLAPSHPKTRENGLALREPSA